VFWLNALLGIAMVGAVACSSGIASKNSPDSSHVAATTSDDNRDGPVDVMCIGEHINNPPESFHYSYKFSNVSGTQESQADITPQSMDIVRKDGTGSHSYHGVRSDEQSWNSAVLDLSSLRITGLSARLQSLNHTSALSPKGSESINGYKANIYSIDTTNANAKDKEQYETLFGKGSFEKGTAWMGADGCIVKLILDESTTQANGAVDKGHYEMDRSKK
jgi:hypothetical protein